MSNLICRLGGWRGAVAHGRIRFESSRLAFAVFSMLFLLPVGCTTLEPLAQPQAIAPPPAFTGPRFLHGTVGSLTRVRGDQPLLVSGWGVVADLDGTGSADVPMFLRQRMINQLGKRGLGSRRLGMEDLTPERFLNSKGTTCVAVEGLIPPGAVKGSRFDVLARTIQLQTTSLNGGRLWTTELAIAGANKAMRFSRPLAQARGPLYLNPFEDNGAEQAALDRPDLARAVVIAGADVTEDRRLELWLNQPNYKRSRMISNRINERFPKGIGDRYPTANAKSDVLIHLHIPSRYGHNPKRLLNLILHLYIDSAPNFAFEKSQVLADLLVNQLQWAGNIALAWEALGNPARWVIQGLYDHPDLRVRLTALRTGVQLEDARTIDHLSDLAGHEDSEVRLHVAQALVHLPKSIRASSLLQELVNDGDRAVRIAAYKSLADFGDPVIERRVFGQREKFKCVLDLVPSKRPLLYLSQVGLPRVVVFSPDTGFKTPLFASMWDNRLMLRADGPDDLVSVFYQPRRLTESQPRGMAEPKIHQIVPAVANLVYLMAHEPDVENPAPGLDLSYSDLAQTLYQLAREGKIVADVELEVNALAAAITRTKSIPFDPMREVTETETSAPDSSAVSQIRLEGTEPVRTGPDTIEANQVNTESRAFPFIGP